jgi:hypothetical protein
MSIFAGQKACLVLKAIAFAIWAAFIWFQALNLESSLLHEKMGSH